MAAIGALPDGPNHTFWPEKPLFIAVPEKDVSVFENELRFYAIIRQETSRPSSNQCRLLCLVGNFLTAFSLNFSFIFNSSFVNWERAIHLALQKIQLSFKFPVLRSRTSTNVSSSEWRRAQLVHDLLKPEYLFISISSSSERSLYSALASR